jgi:hypothetical protein
MIGILVKLIIPIDSVDKHETIGIMINGEVKPLASILWEKQEEIPLLGSLAHTSGLAAAKSHTTKLLTVKLEKMKKNKKPSIKIRNLNVDNEVVIKNKEFNYEYSMVVGNIMMIIFLILV